MIHNNHFMFWAARSIGKTWLTALFCIIRCILYPGSKICVASSTRSQGNEVLLKITDDFMKNYSWGSENLKREISYTNVGANKAVIEFKNGSWIKVVTAADTARGNRANVLVIDEFRMVDKETINTVLRRFLGSPRQPMYLSEPEYANKEEYLETNTEIYMSSAWYKSHWSYDKSKAYTVNFLGGREGYFVCGLPYQIAIREGLKKRIEIEDEMSEIDFDENTFSMEMGCLPFGDTDGSFFTFDDVSSCRNLKNPVYKSNSINNKSVKIPDLVSNERRILSVDIALMASGKHKNDASSIIINSAIPKNDNSYVGNIIYLENQEGLRTEELALIIRRLFDEFKCTDLVLDCNGNGLSVFDALSIDIYDNDTGKTYQALSCCNNKEMADRCKIENAPKVIWAIKATENFNDEICKLLRNGFKSNRLNLLVNEFEAEEILKDRFGKKYINATQEEKTRYKLPYIQTTLMIYELIQLDHKSDNGKIKIKEKSGARKDRYSSLAYNYWVQCELERENLRKKKKSFSMSDYANRLKKLNKKPNMY